MGLKIITFPGHNNAGNHKIDSRGEHSIATSFLAQQAHMRYIKILLNYL